MAATLVTVPYHLGRPRVGTGRGPEQIARWALADLPERDIDVRAVESVMPFAHEVGATFALHAALAEEVRVVRLRKRLPIVLAGNCSSCLGTLAAMEPGRRGIVWFDAHADLHTPDTTLTGFLDGMALSSAIGRCWRGLAAAIPGFQPVSGDDVVLVGGRSMDPAEAALIRVGSVTRVSEALVRRSGVSAALGVALGGLRSRVDGIYLHVDLDVLDPDEVPANQWGEPNGLGVDELLAAIDMVAAACRIDAVGVASYDPVYDPHTLAREPLRRLLDRLVAAPRESASPGDDPGA